MTDDWLEVHRVWHQLGGRSTATMMFGHVETLEERVEHFERVRQLQDETGGFTAFISWTFQPEHTDMADVPPAGAFEYLKTQAISRIYLDNVAEYPVVLGHSGPQDRPGRLYFGANDMGSLMIEENVVSSAGTVYHLSLEEIRRAIRESGYIPRQRNVFYEYIDEEPAASGSTVPRRGDGRLNAISRGGGRLGLAVVVIQVEHLCKSFLDYQRGWVAAVNDVIFECHPGAIFGLLGPNGAGKTTTLRILSTVLRPTGGRAIVAGHDVCNEPEKVRAKIGYMSASTGIYDRMTAWELVEYFGRLYGMSRDRLTERMETIFDWLKMNDFRDVLGSKMFDRDEAEGLHRPDDRPRPARPDLRRADLRPGRPGGSRRPPEDPGASRPGQDDRLLHAFDARGREALLAGGDHLQGPRAGRRHARRSAAAV